MKTIILALTACCCAGAALAQAADPGVRGGPAGAGPPFAGLTAAEKQLWGDARNRFEKTFSVSGSLTGEPGIGLGPRFNGNGCIMCHSQPAPGGTAPAVNPQVAVATLDGATNTLPPFITLNGPIREARFPSDSGVHDLFTIQGRSDASGCTVAQPDFIGNAVSFRIPTPLFGVGLVENTPDETLEADAQAVSAARLSLNIRGHFNHKLGGAFESAGGSAGGPLFNNSGSTGAITKFGWKAQNASLLFFAGEAQNVELGVTSDSNTLKRGITGNDGDGGAVGCEFNPLPEDTTSIVAQTGIPGGPTFKQPASGFISDTVAFGIFMRLNQEPIPIPDTPSIVNGRNLFSSIGCGGCHIPQHVTGPSVFTGQSNRTFSPFSDFQVHSMGPNLADGVTQGEADPTEFRTAPLWGAGQRIFFLHDGRTTDLVAAIEAHKSGHGSNASEANAVIQQFNALPVGSQQDILNFLRGL